MLNAIAEAYAPASAANLGVGFDAIGLALEKPGDTVCVAPRDKPGVVITRIEGDDGVLSYDPAENCASVAAQSVLNIISPDRGVSLTLRKGLPIGSGLGSSAASAVAGAFAVNALFGNPLTRDQLLSPALDGEAIVSGYHPDNVGPSLFGGITLFFAPRANAMVHLPVPQNLHLALVSPQVVIKTADARAVLPTSVPLADMIWQTAAVGRLVDALYRGDIRAIGAAMESDRVVEPARQHLMPHFQHVRAAAHDTGAHGLVISGAGPALLAVCDNPQTAAAVAAAMQSVYTQAGIPSKSQHGQVFDKGAHTLRVEPHL